MRKPGKCKHFNGIQHEQCLVGVPYVAAGLNPEPGAGVSRLACLRTADEGRGLCRLREDPTPEEVAEDEAKMLRGLDCMRRGVSSCCEAPLNTAMVIEAGPYKGHGPRYCSGCGRLAFMV